MDLRRIKQTNACIHHTAVRLEGAVQLRHTQKHICQPAVALVGRAGAELGKADVPHLVR